MPVATPRLVASVRDAHGVPIYPSSKVSWEVNLMKPTEAVREGRVMKVLGRYALVRPIQRGKGFQARWYLGSYLEKA